MSKTLKKIMPGRNNSYESLNMRTQPSLKTMNVLHEKMREEFEGEEAFSKLQRKQVFDGIGQTTSLLELEKTEDAHKKVTSKNINTQKSYPL